DVHVAVSLVAGDLNVSDEDGPSGNREVHWGTPSDTVISRMRDRDGGPSGSEVVPGNVQSPVEGRGSVGIGPARLSIVTAAAVNAEMGPASRRRIKRSRGLVPAEA